MIMRIVNPKTYDS